MAKEDDVKITISQKGTIPVYTRTKTGGQTIVQHDSTLKGSGTNATPLGISDEIMQKIESLPKYLSVERLDNYVFKVTFDTIPEYDPIISYSADTGACTSFVRNGKLYRNFDWKYDNRASFVVVCKDFQGMAYITGLDDGTLDSKRIAQLPYHLVDGVNKNGIKVSTHVLYNDWEYDGAGNKDQDIMLLPYYILSNLHSISDIQTVLDDYVSNIKIPEALANAEYLLQFVVTDGTTTYCIMPPENNTGSYVIQNITSNPKLTNFRWVDKETVVRTELQERPTGVERWNEVATSELEDLRFTKCYEEPTRLSEFIGIDETTKDSTDEELLNIYIRAHAAYETRTRDGLLWQTVHSVVFSDDCIEYLWCQENWNKDYSLEGKVEKTYAPLKVYGTDDNGNQTLYDKEADFGKIDTITVNGELQPVVDKNVEVPVTFGNTVGDPKDNEELKELFDEIDRHLDDTDQNVMNNTEYINEVNDKTNQEIQDRQDADQLLSDRLDDVEEKIEDIDDFVPSEITPTTTNFVPGTSYDIHEALQRTANLFGGYKGEIDTINAKIPSQATSTNQLADKAFVNSSIATEAANFRGNWANWDDVPTDAEDYPADYTGSHTPSHNDYMVIEDSSDYPITPAIDGRWRFIYVGEWETDGKNGWQKAYSVGSTFTAAQQAAIDSTITKAVVDDYVDPNSSASTAYNSRITAVETDKRNNIYSANKVYATGANGAQKNDLAYSKTAVADTIVQRDANGEIMTAEPTTDNSATNKWYVDDALQDKQDQIDNVVNDLDDEIQNRENEDEDIRNTISDNYEELSENIEGRVEKSGSSYIVYGTNEDGNDITYDYYGFVHKQNPDDEIEELEDKKWTDSVNRNNYMIVRYDEIYFHNALSRFAHYTINGVQTNGGYFNFPTGKTTSETFAMLSDLTSKQDKLTAGDGIDITNNTVSIDEDVVATKSYVDTADNKKQDKLTSVNAGMDIDISTETLPAGYTRLQYIQRDTASQGYVNLGRWSSMPPYVDIDCEITRQVTSQYNLIGAYCNSSQAYQYGVYISSDGLITGSFGGNYSYNGIACYVIPNKRMLITYKNNPEGLHQRQILADGTESVYAINTYSDLAINYDMYAFAVNYRNGPTGYSYAKIYSIKCYDGSKTLTKNYIPAKNNSTSGIGFYETVGGVWYPMSGTMKQGPAISDGSPIISEKQDKGKITFVQGTVSKEISLNSHTSQTINLPTTYYSGYNTRITSNNTIEACTGYPWSPWATDELQLCIDDPRISHDLIWYNTGWDPHTLMLPEDVYIGGDGAESSELRKKSLTVTGTTRLYSDTKVGGSLTVSGTMRFDNSDNGIWLNGREVHNVGQVFMNYEPIRDCGDIYCRNVHSNQSLYVNSAVHAGGQITAGGTLKAKDGKFTSSLQCAGTMRVGYDSDAGEYDTTKPLIAHNIRPYGNGWYEQDGFYHIGSFDHRYTEMWTNDLHVDHIINQEDNEIEFWNSSLYTYDHIVSSLGRTMNAEYFLYPVAKNRNSYPVKWRSEGVEYFTEKIRPEIGDTIYKRNPYGEGYVVDSTVEELGTLTFNEPLGYQTKIEIPYYPEAYGVFQVLCTDGIYGKVICDVKIMPEEFVAFDAHYNKAKSPRCLDWGVVALDDPTAAVVITHAAEPGQFAAIQVTAQSTYHLGFSIRKNLSEIYIPKCQVYALLSETGNLESNDIFACPLVNKNGIAGPYISNELRANVIDSPQTIFFLGIVDELGNVLCGADTSESTAKWIENHWTREELLELLFNRNPLEN